MSLKVIIWNTGFIGRTALRHVLDRSDMELVGVKCFSPEKEGVDAGDIVNRPKTGVEAMGEESAVLRLDADCVAFAPNDTALADPTVPGSQSHENFLTTLRILRAGKNVVTSITSPTHYRHMQDPDWFITHVEEACRAGGSSLHYTGIDPGFFTDALAFHLSSGSGIVTRIQTWEVLDYFPIPRHASLSRMGFGKTENEMIEGGKGEWVRQTWGGVPYLLAEAFGVDIDRLEIELEFWLAPAPITTPHNYRVERGTIGAYRFALHGIVNGERMFTTHHINRLGPGTAPDWVDVGPDGGYRIVIDGTTPMSVEIPLGNPGGRGSAFADANQLTAARVVNMIPPVVQASPGYKTFLDLLPARPFLALPGHPLREKLLHQRTDFPQ